MVERETSTICKICKEQETPSTVTNLLNLFFWYCFNRWYLKFGHQYLWEKRGWFVSKWHKLREGYKRT